MNATTVIEITDKQKIGLISLGCPKNLVDSEELLGAFTQTGAAQIVDSNADADVLVVNTCAFIESAKQESIEAILSALKRKKRGDVRRVVVTGCLAQRYGDELAKELPEVDAFFGIQSGEQAAIALFGSDTAPMRRLVGKELPIIGTANQVAPITEKYPLIPPTRVRATAPWTAYLKVSEGCDHACTFCSIPSFRGRHRSKPIERIVNEAKLLADSGTTEINLIAQDTTAYGMDLYRELALPRLLEALNEIESLRWIRLLYCYPTMMTDRLIKTMANLERVAHYVDIPLQHGDDAMLKRMKRGGNVASYLRLVEFLRTAMPDMAIRTTFLVGFPGEDGNAIRNLQGFMESAQFDRVGIFTYSPEENTPGHAMTPRVGQKIAMQRKNSLMAIQQPISLERNRLQVGKTTTVLVEGQRGDSLIARSWRDAPEIDGAVIVHHSNAKPGEWLNVRVTDAQPYDLIAVPA